jgi:hypothetical protein
MASTGYAIDAGSPNINASTVRKTRICGPLDAAALNQHLAESGSLCQTSRRRCNGEE